MTTFAVVEDLDVLDDRSPSLGSADEAGVMD
jgi:hypothetical protein